MQTLVFDQHPSGLSICCGKKLGRLWVSYPSSKCRGGCWPWPCSCTVNTNWVLCCECTVLSAQPPGWLYFTGSTVFCSCSDAAVWYTPVCKGLEVPDTSAVLLSDVDQDPSLFPMEISWCSTTAVCGKFVMQEGEQTCFTSPENLGSLGQVLRLLGGTEQAHRAEGKTCSHYLFVRIHSETLACKLSLL